jgi:2-dehydropantoate 2-reductase
MSAAAIDGQAHTFEDSTTCHGLFDSHMRTRKVLPKFPTTSGGFVNATTVDLDQSFFQPVCGLHRVIYGLLCNLYFASMSKISIIGCGAVGLNYATRLLEAQIYHDQPFDVSLVLRRDYELVSTEGLIVEYGKATEQKTYLHFSSSQLAGKLFRSTTELLEAKGTMDWVIVSCKSYSIDESLHDSLKPIVGEHTKIMVIMNGLGVEEKFVEWFGPERVYGALTRVACNRGPNPPVELGPLVVNVYLDLELEVAHITDDASKTQLVIDLFKHTAIHDIVKPTSNLLRARWAKLCWNLAFAGIGVAMGGLTCDVIVHDPSLRKLANNLICDVIRVANADILRQHTERHSSGQHGRDGGAGSSCTETALPPCPDLLKEKDIIGKMLLRDSTL